MTDLEEVVWNAYVHDGRPPCGTHEETLTQHYLPLAARLATAMGRRLGDKYDNFAVLAAAYVGLVKAIRTFDPDSGEAFEGHASPTIRHAILDASRRGSFNT